ncbi:MAG: hypothetical protein RL336_1284 [Pseudomonadota bacterium]
MSTVCIVTVSYAPDFPRCQRLCDSIDTFVDKSIEHLVICPADQRDLFAPLANTRRRIISYQEVLPKGFRRVPLTKKWWLDDQFFPVRGWVLQQLIKLSSHTATEADVLLFVDSDIVFFKHFDSSILFQGEKTRLLRVPCSPPSGVHSEWQRVAEKLFGLPEQPFIMDYVGQLISWRRDHLQAMLQHIEHITGKAWHHAVGHQKTVSEYILYGNFIERCLQDHHQHILEQHLISCNIWD